MKIFLVFKLFTGQRFALLELKTVIIRMVPQLKIMLGYEGFEPDFYCDALIKSANGIQLKFKER